MVMELAFYGSLPGLASDARQEHCAWIAEQVGQARKMPNVLNGRNSLWRGLVATD